MKTKDTGIFNDFPYKDPKLAEVAEGQRNLKVSLEYVLVVQRADCITKFAVFFLFVRRLYFFFAGAQYY